MCLVFFLFSEALRNALYKGVSINCADTDILRRDCNVFWKKYL